eukprot:437624_1
MGRKKISIEPISHPSTRRATFEKRRIGLFKKAIELSILCKSTVSVTIYSSDGEVYIYSSEPYENVIQLFQHYRGSYRLLTNDHLDELIPGKSSSSSAGFQIIKQANSQILPSIPANTQIIMPNIQSMNTLINHVESVDVSTSTSPPSPSSSLTTHALGFNHIQIQQPFEHVYHGSGMNIASSVAKQLNQQKKKKTKKQHRYSGKRRSFEEMMCCDLQIENIDQEISITPPIESSSLE